MGDDVFKEIVSGVLGELPPELREALGTVQIVVQQRPDSGQLRRSGLRAGEDLFGLFEGLSLKEWPLGKERYFPDRVVLFEESLRRHCPRQEDLKREIRKTLVHELGHFFGFSEKEIRERGYG